MTTAQVAPRDVVPLRVEAERVSTDTPLTAHRGWLPSEHRADPVALLEEQNRSRDTDLVPVRHGRMLVSPFTFYRGTARIMAEDLRGSPTAGYTVQLCGDAHLSNFGLFASPERNLVFDINDFDETLPGPFEYDVKRLAASFTVAARHLGFSTGDTRDATRASVSSYRAAMAEFARMSTLDIWYAHLSAKDIMAGMRAARTGRGLSEKDRKSLKKREKVAKSVTKAALQRDSAQALAKLAERVEGRYRMVSQPPLIVPRRDWQTIYPHFPADVEQVISAQLASYTRSLPPDRRQLLQRFELVDVARKVVGVGSVGTRAFVVLMQGKEHGDPLFLQLKEANRSVLESHLPRSRYRAPGERVVQGQRMMQATSDIFLGWTRGVDGMRSYYCRQLRDMKGSVDVEAMTPSGLTAYAGICGWTLARAHARSGDPAGIARYLGGDDTFDRSIANFAKRYADQNDRDFAAFSDAVRTGRLEAAAG